MLFRRARQGKCGGGVAPYVRGRFNIPALKVRDYVVESLWVRIRGIENKAGIVVGAYYRSPSQDDSPDKLFARQLGEMWRNIWISSRCPSRRFQLPRHQLGKSSHCDKQAWEISEVC